MILLNKETANPRDPYVLFYENKYYTLFSMDNSLWMKCTDSLKEIEKADKHLVYTPKDEYKVSLWAPELHIIDGVPYIYVTAAKEHLGVQHMFVLSHQSNNLLDPYEKISYLPHTDDGWGIDGTILRLNQKLYYIYSAFGKYKEELYQSLYIREMINPYTFKSEPHLLSRSIYEWEKHGCNGKDRPYVNEGAFAIYHHNKTYVVYSASGCWTDYYCLGLLEYLGGDPLDIISWKKYNKPILDNSSGFVGPGHASFIQNDPSGTEYCAFHAYLEDSSRGEAFVRAYIYPLIWKDNLPIILLDKEEK